MTKRGLFVKGLCGYVMGISFYSKTSKIDQKTLKMNQNRSKMAKNDQKIAFFILSTSYCELLAKVINTHVNF